MGGCYTYDDLSSMLKRSIETANVRRAARGVAPMAPVGYRDLKGKGLTDMYCIDQVSITQIQQLLGHSSATTTEIYIKARWRETAQPKRVSLGICQAFHIQWFSGLLRGRKTHRRGRDVEQVSQLTRARARPAGRSKPSP
jgi:hypothetical protein